MNLLKKAISIAKEAYKNQEDKGGNDYFSHPWRIMHQMPTTKLMIIAILHDVVEDSSFTLEYLRKNGFTKDIVEAIDALSKKEDESYEKFIKRVKKNELATIVKLADLKDNINLDRIPQPTAKDLKRVDKYKRAIEYLS